MLFGRKKNNFNNTDLFPLTDTVVDFEDTVQPGEQPARRLSDAPKPPPRRTNGQKWLIACTLVTLYLVAMAAFQNLGMVEKSTVLYLFASIVAGLSIFYFIFKARINQYFREKRLKLPIVAISLAAMLIVDYFEPATAILLTPFSFVAISYGMYRITRRDATILVILVILSFAGITGLHFHKWHNPALLKIEVLHLIALTLTLPAFVFLTGKVQHLHRVLHRASRKIKNIQEDAQRDTLVGCFNRRYMVAALEVQKQWADEHGEPLCLAVVDLDHFKKINDELGHLGGDEVLRTFSRIAQESVRGGDIFGRYGGEEFLLIFPNTSLLPALNTSERIRSQVEQYKWDGALQCRVSVSIGVTQYIPGESVLELFSRADTAMYMAKQGGRNQVVVEEPVPGKK